MFNHEDNHYKIFRNIDENEPLVIMPLVWATDEAEITGDLEVLVYVFVSVLLVVFQVCYYGCILLGCFMIILGGYVIVYCGGEFGNLSICRRGKVTHERF